MKILFIGASGMLGKPVAQELINAGFGLTLLARDVNKMQALFPGTTVIKGDVFDKNSLVNAMKDMDAVYCNLSVAPNSKEKDPQPEREGIDNIIAAAKETGIKRIAVISSLVHRYEGMNGFHWWAFQVKNEAVRKIKASGIPYTIFYPSTFMECFPYQMMRGKKIGMIGTSKESMWFIAAVDYGKQVAASFKKLGSENKEYSVQGPEALDFKKSVSTFIENYRKAKLGTMRAPMGVMKLIGLFNPRFNYGWRICEALNKYPEKFESEQTWQELGKPATTLKAYAASL